jgi:ferrous iron transport protein B
VLVALVGNPNCGKTAVFNRLTGAREKVGNYAGVTVERKAGALTTSSGRAVQVLDLPGTYSFRTLSVDEAVARDVCLGERPGEGLPDLLICVVDATNLRLNLRFALEVRDLGRPMVVALNQMDAAARRGITIDVDRLAAGLGVPVIPTVAIRRGGVDELVRRFDEALPAAPPRRTVERAALHDEVRALLDLAVTVPRRTSELDDRIDRWVLHPVFGLVLLAVTLFLTFQAVYVGAAPFMDGLEAGVGWVGERVGAGMADGPLRDLLVEGVIAGVGSVVVFLPQILILFAFILVLEESGYLPRAAFLLDRFMAGAGLTGRSFIPLLSSFACAVPGIMATRSIRDPWERLAAILVAPLMTCSARLPVYALLIGAFIPDHRLAGFVSLQGLVLFGLYAAAVASAMAVAFTMSRLRGAHVEPTLLLELPSYHRPDPTAILLGLWERASIFLRRVGTILLPVSVLVWFLASFPGPTPGQVEPAIQTSYAGRLGTLLHPLFEPVGFTWEIVVALVPGVAAREVMVSALATVYATGAEDDVAALSTRVAQDWSLPTALSLLAWYVFAPQCVSTIAVIRRETGSWRHTGFAVAYLTALAWIAAFLTYQTARGLGW